jgi:hypothetical protein
MVFFDVGYAFVSAGALGWRAKGGRRDLALLYVGTGVLPAGLAFLEGYPDWDWQYLVDPATLPSGAPAAFAGAIMLAGLAGHWLGGRSKKGLIAAAAALGLFGLVTIQRTVYVGDLAAWEAGTAELLPMHWLIFSAPWMTASALLFGLFFYLAGQPDKPATTGG